MTFKSLKPASTKKKDGTPVMDFCDSSSSIVEDFARAMSITCILVTKADAQLYGRLTSCGSPASLATFIPYDFGHAPPLNL